MRSPSGQQELLAEFVKLGPEQQARVLAFARSLAGAGAGADAHNEVREPSARPIEEVLAQLASEVPEEEWKKLPEDLSENLDHYLYGTPKR